MTTTAQRLNKMWNRRAERIIQLEKEKAEILEALKFLVTAEFGSFDHPQIKDSALWNNAVIAIKKAEGE